MDETTRCSSTGLVLRWLYAQGKHRSKAKKAKHIHDGGVVVDRRNSGISVIFMFRVMDTTKELVKMVPVE